MLALANHGKVAFGHHSWIIEYLYVIKGHSVQECREITGISGDKSPQFLTIPAIIDKSGLWGQWLSVPQASLD